MKSNLYASVATVAVAAVVGLAFAPTAYATNGADLVPVPAGSANATFYFNQRFIPQIGQTYTVTSPHVIDSVMFQPYAVTVVDNTRYFTASEAERHELEFWQPSYSGLATQGRLIIWRSNGGGDPGTTFSVADGWTKIAETPIDQTLEIGKPNRISLGTPVTLSPGTYFVEIGMKLNDPKILSVHMTGRESGNNTNAGPLGDRPASCNYTRSEDSYPGGRAYRGIGQVPYNGAEDNYLGFGSTFVEHGAKVQECIKIGSYDDIFNPGDLAMNLVEAGSNDSTGLQVAPSVSAAFGATFGPIKPNARGTSVAVKRQDSQSVVVLAYRTPEGGVPEVRCTVSGKAKSCTLIGLKPATRYYLALAKKDLPPDASNPRIPVMSKP